MNWCRQGRSLPLLTFVAFVAIFAAIFIPVVVMSAPRKATQCAINLLHIAQGRQPPSPKCPMSALPYATAEKDGRKVVSCPDPERHLLTDPRFVTKDGRTAFRQTFPDAPALPETGVELSDGDPLGATTISEKPDAVEIDERKGFFVRILLAGLCGLGAIAFLGWMVWMWIDRARLRPDAPNRPEGFMIVLGILVAAILGFVCYNFGSDRIIRIPMTGGEVRIQNRFFGAEVSDPAVRGGIRAMVAAGSPGRLFLRVVFDDGAAVDTLELCRLTGDELGALSVVHRALFPEPR